VRTKESLLEMNSVVQKVVWMADSMADERVDSMVV
jgi:hypothetical protein